jgi:hypothetical protein
MRRASAIWRQVLRFQAARAQLQLDVTCVGLGGEPFQLSLRECVEGQVGAILDNVHSKLVGTVQQIERAQRSVRPGALVAEFEPDGPHITVGADA